MRLGIIADTHGLLRPEVFEVFAEVDHILHAGDIGSLDLLSELEAIAPLGHRHNSHHDKSSFGTEVYADQLLSGSAGKASQGRVQEITEITKGLKTLAKELGPSNILLNVVAPGRIQTERIEELDQATASRRGLDLQQVKKESVASIPLGRLGTPEEFANLLVFLASDAGRYISGQAIIVDGGATAAL